MWLEDQRRDLQGNLGRIQSKLAGLKERTNLSDKEQDELQDLQRQSDDITAHLEGGFAEDRITKVRAAAQQRDKERQDQIAKLRAEAHKQADMLIPPSLTVAGMGITGSFFIELTAILTIIFGIIILGLVGVLTSTEIAPILAAIAGYVLGKTTSGWAPYGGAASMQQPPTPQAAAPPSPKPGASSEAK